MTDTTMALQRKMRPGGPVNRSGLTAKLNVLAVCAVFAFVGAILLGAF